MVSFMGSGFKSKSHIEKVIKTLENYDTKLSSLEKAGEVHDAKAEEHKQRKLEADKACAALDEKIRNLNDREVLLNQKQQFLDEKLSQCTRKEQELDAFKVLLEKDRVVLNTSLKNAAEAEAKKKYELEMATRKSAEADKRLADLDAKERKLRELTTFLRN